MLSRVPDNLAVTKEEEVMGQVRIYNNNSSDSDDNIGGDNNIGCQYFPPSRGLHEDRALFATFTSLNPLTRPGTLAKTGVWSRFT